MGNEVIAQALIESGANISATTNDGDSALIFSCSNSKQQLQKSFIRFCTDFQIKKNLINDKKIHITDRRKLVKMLIDKGADINHKGYNDRTPLMEISRHGEHFFLFNRCEYYNNNFNFFFCFNHIFVGSEEIVQLLLDKGASINAVDKNYRTALDAASEANEGSYQKYSNF